MDSYHAAPRRNNESRKMELLFSVQIGAISLALLAHFVGFLRTRLVASRARTHARLFSYARTGLMPETLVEHATYPG